MNILRKYDEVFKELEEDIIRRHENEDCSELAERGLTLVHSYLPDEGVIVRLETSNKNGIFSVPVNNKAGYDSFEYHEFLVVGRHVFDPDTEEKFFPIKEYIETLFKLNPTGTMLVSDNKAFNRMITKVVSAMKRQKECIRYNTDEVEDLANAVSKELKRKGENEMSENMVKGFADDEEKMKRVRRDFYSFMMYYAENTAESIINKDKYCFVPVSDAMYEVAHELERDVIELGKPFEEKSSKSIYTSKLVSKLDEEVSFLDEDLADYTESEDLNRVSRISTQVDKLVRKGQVSVYTTCEGTYNIIIELFDRARCLGRVTSLGSECTLEVDMGKPDVFTSFSLNTARVTVVGEERKEVYYLRGDFSRQSADQKGARVKTEVLIIDGKNKLYGIQELVGQEKESILDFLMTVM